MTTRPRNRKSTTKRPKGTGAKPRRMPDAIVKSVFGDDRAMSPSEFEAGVALINAGLREGMVREHHFSDERGWRFDFAWPAVQVAVEVEGGVWSYGRHLRGSGYLRDVEKYNAAALAGWRVLRLPTPWLEAVNQTSLMAMLRGLKTLLRGGS